jgi:hypothetical protein
MNWKELGEKIAALTDEQRLQPVQVVNISPNGNDVNELMPGVEIDTVDGFGIYAARSIVDNKRNGKEVVLLIDHNPFGEDGVIAWEWIHGEEDKPIYGREGKTDPALQRATMDEDSRDNAPHVMAVVESRMTLHERHK